MSYNTRSFLLTSCLITVAASTTPHLRTRRSFVPSKLEGPSIPFEAGWINDFGIQATGGNNENVPTNLMAPNFVPTFDLYYRPSSSSIEQVAEEAKQYILQYTTNSTSIGAVLFRGLDQLLHDASEFEAFWSFMEWDPVTHISCYNRKRKSVGSVDMVDTDVPKMTIGPHNEHACNRQTTGRIAFYGLQPAPLGGESLIRRNSDIRIPQHVKDFVEQHGGIQTVRIYPDHIRMIQDTGRHPTSMSWQERCKTDSQEDCQRFFADHGINGTTVFDENGTLTVTSTHSGWHNDQWFNHIDYGFPTRCADGTAFPQSWQMELKQRKWWETYAYKLQKGDWLVVDNTSIQHGRLPYEGERQLIVSYTN